MVGKALLGQLLILCALATKVGVGINADATTRCKEARHLNIFGIHQANEVFHDYVYTVFMKVAMVTKAEEIQLQALALNHAHVGHIADTYLGKVGLTRNGAQRGKLGSIKTHPIVVVWMLIYKGFKHLGGIIVAVARLGAKGLQALIFSIFHIQ